MMKRQSGKRKQQHYCRERDEQILQAQHLLIQVKMFSFHFVNQLFSSGMPVPNQEYDSYFQHYWFVDIIEQFFCLVSLKDFSLLEHALEFSILLYFLLLQFVCLALTKHLFYFAFYFPGRGKAEAEEETDVCMGQEMAIRQKKDNAMATIALW